MGRRRRPMRHFHRLLSHRALIRRNRDSPFLRARPLLRMHLLITRNRIRSRKHDMISLDPGRRNRDSHLRKRPRRQSPMLNILFDPAAIHKRLQRVPASVQGAQEGRQSRDLGYGDIRVGIYILMRQVAPRPSPRRCII
jgi:hypothetical protein